MTHQPQPRVAEHWSLGPPLPAPRGELATAVGYVQPCRAPPCPEGERLFVLGGLSGFFIPESRVEVFDPTRNTWSVGPQLPAPRHHFAAARLGDELYVSGGTDVAGAHLGHRYWPPHNIFWLLSAGADKWQTLPPMIEPRWGHRMVTHAGRLFVIGGRGRSGRVLIYTPGKGWSLGAEMPRVRDHLSVVEVGGKLWAIGGPDPNSIAGVDTSDPGIEPASHASTSTIRSSTHGYPGRSFTIQPAVPPRLSLTGPSMCLAARNRTSSQVRSRTDTGASIPAQIRRYGNRYPGRR